jgi:sialic acid synthase SpsE
MRTKLCAELGTAHHGDIGVALQMIQAAADAGCDAVKIQHYGAVNPADPQAEWLNQSRLHVDAISTLSACATGHGLDFWVTPFSRGAWLEVYDRLPGARMKIASSESGETWWQLLPKIGRAVVSYPWGKGVPLGHDALKLTAIPLYPTPPECVGQAMLLDGWSDHVVGTLACQYAICHGAQWIEAHLKLPGVTTRDRDWEKTPADFKMLRQFAEDVATMRSGVGQTFRDRWQKSV